MRLWCAAPCGKSCGRVERDETGDWIYIGAWKIPPSRQVGDARGFKGRTEVNLTRRPLPLSVNCAGGHVCETHQRDLLTAARAGQRDLALTRAML